LDAIHKENKIKKKKKNIKSTIKYPYPSQVKIISLNVCIFCTKAYKKIEKVQLSLKENCKIARNIFHEYKMTKNRLKAY
jgi:hypothetical protein